MHQASVSSSLRVWICPINACAAFHACIYPRFRRKVSGLWIPEFGLSCANPAKKLRRPEHVRVITKKTNDISVRKQSIRIIILLACALGPNCTRQKTFNLNLKKSTLVYINNVPLITCAFQWLQNLVTACRAVFLFWRIHRLGHPENNVFLSNKANILRIKAS